jgi:molecular chaperone HscB
MLEQRQRDMEAALQQLFVQWDALQDREEATEQARVERSRVLKQMRENLSNRTYVKNIVSDLVSTIG